MIDLTQLTFGTEITAQPTTKQYKYRVISTTGKKDYTYALKVGNITPTKLLTSKILSVDLIPGGYGMGSY